jgi:hypothetical protein
MKFSQPPFLQSSVVGWMKIHAAPNVAHRLHRFPIAGAFDKKGHTIC